MGYKLAWICKEIVRLAHPLMFVITRIWHGEASPKRNIYHCKPWIKVLTCKSWLFTMNKLHGKSFKLATMGSDQDVLIKVNMQIIRYGLIIELDLPIKIVHHCHTITNHWGFKTVQLITHNTYLYVQMHMWHRFQYLSPWKTNSD